MAPPKDTARMLGAKALAAGLLCWAVNVALVLTVGRYGPSLVLLGALGVFFGAVLVVWGESFRAMSLAQKVPAALIALAATPGPALLLMRWASSVAAD